MAPSTGGPAPRPAENGITFRVKLHRSSGDVGPFCPDCGSRLWHFGKGDYACPDCTVIVITVPFPTVVNGRPVDRPA